MNIQPVVEGHGEVAAVPVLLRRLIEEARGWEVGVAKPIRRPRRELATEQGVSRAVTLAQARPDCGGILLLFDSDDDCPAELGPRVQAWATAASAAMPCAVCMAHREYEAWFLATADSLRDHKAMSADATAHLNPEGPRGAKAELERHMAVNDYKESLHQAAFSAQMCLGVAFRRCRSFRKLVSSFGTLMDRMGQLPPTWPPRRWVEDGLPAGKAKSRGP